MSNRFLCIHGHFYQPPRENPWIEKIEVQDSATPFHDWNERIDRECYAPNAVSRKLDNAGRILNVVNNFEKISFNIGPTLFSWLERYDTDTYERICEADRKSVRVNDGHGSAIAQAYNHLIMPLASLRDKKTQVKWGIADFVRRFGREPEGMWLPETAACTETLEVLADEAIKFTILSQNQAKAIKEPGWNDFGMLETGIDPTRPYLARLPSGRSITLFFYDGPISRAVAFERLLTSGEKFADRLRSGFSDNRSWDQLLHIATDGETFGHHHRFGEMALTRAIDLLEKSDDLIITNYACYLAHHKPEVEVKIFENSSWSCAHGVQRWKNDCGCAIDPQRGWHQKWRAPLRSALDDLKEKIDKGFEEKGGTLFDRPWSVRDRFVEVMLDRSKGNDFVAEHAKQESVTDDTKVAMLKLLEMERHGMLMYTSCGWFFDDISGIETVQILKYAARSAQLYKEVIGDDIEDEFIEMLSHAPSNLTGEWDGAAIYRKWVLPEKSDLCKVVANSALMASIDPDDTKDFSGMYNLNMLEQKRDGFGDNAISITRYSATCQMTGQKEEFVTLTLKLGSTDAGCYVKKSDRSRDTFRSFAQSILSQWHSGPLTAVIRKIDQWSGESGTDYYQAKDMFMENRRKAVSLMAASQVEKLSQAYRSLFTDNRRTIDYFIEQSVPVPDELKISARYIIEKEMAQGATDLSSVNRIENFLALFADVQRWQLTFDIEPSAKAVENWAFGELVAITKGKSGKTDSLVRALVAIESAGFQIDLWRLQNLYAENYLDNNHAILGIGKGGIRNVGILLGFSTTEKRLKQISGM